MMRKRKETTAERVIIDNEVISVATLKKKASRANAVFWVACLLVAMLSGLVVPYLSMASLAVSSSDAFTGEVIPGYSMGGIEVGAYAVDINSWGQVANPTFTGSTYGIWNPERTKAAQGKFNSATAEGNTEISESSTVSGAQKSNIWHSITGFSAFSEESPNGTSTQSPDSLKYDSIAPYRTASEITYFMSNTPSTSASQNIQVTLFPDFVIFSYDGQHVHALNNPDDSTVSATGSMLDRTSGGDVDKTTAVPVYISLSDIIKAFNLTGITDDQGRLVSIDVVMEHISKEAEANKGTSPTLDSLVQDGSDKNLLYGTSYTDVNGGTGGTSEAFNPYPYSMVFQQSDDSGNLVTSSIYNNSEAYVYFSPESMYRAYIALKVEADGIANQASNELANNDPVTAFQLGYYYAAMAICEAYLTEALPQDMTRGYVGASEDTAPQLQRTTESGSKIGGDAQVSLETALGKEPETAQDFSKITYATLMYDVAHQIDGGDDWLQGNTNAIMNTLSVFGYDSNVETYGTGVMKGMDAITTYRRLTAFTPYEKNTATYDDDSNGSQKDPKTNTSYTSGMYTAPYYPIQQHLMPNTEKSYRFSIVSVIPYNTVTENIAYNGLGKSDYKIKTKLSYSDDFTESFTGLTEYVTKSKSLVDQFNNSSDEDSSTSELQEYQAEIDTDDNGKKVLILSNTSSEEASEQTEQQNMQKRVDSALMAYQSSTMDSDNVHDLCDIVRSVPGIKYETFMRFYNPLKSDGGDTDFFLTRVSPAMTDYFPQILNKGYENSGGEECNWGTSGVSFDYFSIPSFAPCFASHTASTTFYGSLNYELRAFFTKGFLETLSENTNVAVPQLGDYEDAVDEVNEIENQSDKQLDVTKGNIRSLFILAKRILLARTFDNFRGKKNSDIQVPVALLNDDPNNGGDEENFPQNMLTDVHNGSNKEWVHWTQDDWGHDTEEGSDTDDGNSKWSTGAPLSFNTATLARILRGDSTLGGDAANFAKVIHDGEVSSYTCNFTVLLESGTTLAGITPFAWGRSDGQNDSFAQFNYKLFAVDGSNQKSWFEADGHYINFYSDIQLLYNIDYYQRVRDALFDKSGEFYWDDIHDILDTTKYSESPIGVDFYNEGDGNEATDIFTVAFDTGMQDIIGAALSGDTMQDLAIDKANDVYMEEAKELSQEIFKDVLNIKKDMKLISDSMPSQMQNVLAWADYQNSSDSENQYQVDPSEANVVVNVGTGSSSSDSDDSSNSDDAILSKKDLEEYGWEYDPNLNNGAGGIYQNDIGSTSDAINDRESRMARGVAGATWTSTIQPACYTMTAITGRMTSMNTSFDQQYPYYGIVNGRLQSGTDQYALLQAHVIDYSAIASGIAGDLENRQRGNLLIFNNSDSSLISDFLNSIAAFFTEIGLSMIRFTGGLFENLMFTSQQKEKIADVKNVDNSAEASNASEISRAFTITSDYTALSAACTSSYVNMNRPSASSSIFDTTTGALTPANSAMSTASAASTQIEQIGSQALLTSGYGLYSIIQSVALALVMIFLLVIAFRNFISYTTNDRDQLAVAQMQLKTVLPRTIVAILMIGLPPLNGGLGFQGGCYLLLQFLGSIINEISATFVTLSGGGVVDSWVSMIESMGTMDLATLIVWLICALVISACFLIGCIVILIQSLILLLFWLIGPLVWSFYAWPYGSDPNDTSTKAAQQKQLLNSADSIMGRVTQKMHIGVFTRGAVGNAAPSAWIWAYLLTAMLTVVWSLMFWAMSIAVSTVDGGASATSSADVIGTGYNSASSMIANAALFSMSQLGLDPWLQILLLTVICVLIFWLMYKMMMKIFKNVPLNAAAVIPFITGGITKGLKLAPQLAATAARGGAHLAANGMKGVSEAWKNRDKIERNIGKNIAKIGKTASDVKNKGAEGLAKSAASSIQDRGAELARSANKRRQDLMNTLSKTPDMLKKAPKAIFNGTVDTLQNAHESLMDTLQSGHDHLVTAATNFMNDPDKAIDALGNKIYKSADLLKSVKKKADPYLNTAVTNVGDMFRGGVADKDRTSFYDMLDAHRIAATQHDLNNNNHQLETIASANKALNAISRAVTQSEIDKAISGMSDGTRDMLEGAGAIVRNDNGKWTKNSDAIFEARNNLIAHQTQIERNNMQLQKTHDMAERTLSMRHTDFVNGSLQTNTEAINNALNHAEVYYDTRAANNLDEFGTIESLAAHYQQERDYLNGNLPVVNGASVAAAMKRLDEFDGLLMQNRNYGLNDINQASSAYYHAFSNLQLTDSLPPEDRNAYLVKIANDMAQRNGSHILSSNEYRALREHVAQGGVLTGQQSKDLSMTEALNATQANHAPDPIKLETPFDNDELIHYEPSDTDRGIAIRDSQEKLIRRQLADNMFSSTFVNGGGLTRALDKISDDGTDGTHALKAQLASISNIDDADRIIDACRGDDRYDQRVVDYADKIIHESFSEMLKNDDVCAQIAHQVGLDASDLKKPTEEYQKATRNIIRTDMTNHILSDEGLSDDDVATIVGVIGKDAVESNTALRKLNNKKTQVTAEITKNTMNLATTNASLFAAVSTRDNIVSDITNVDTDIKQAQASLDSALEKFMTHEISDDELQAYKDVLSNHKKTKMNLEANLKHLNGQIDKYNRNITELTDKNSRATALANTLRNGIIAIGKREKDFDAVNSDMFMRNSYAHAGMTINVSVSDGRTDAASDRATIGYSFDSSDTQDDNDYLRNRERRKNESELAQQQLNQHRQSSNRRNSPSTLTGRKNNINGRNAQHRRAR